jgi:hypothetical protein
MDLSKIKQKLAANQSKGQQREKIDYSKIFWKPKPGKHQIRIVPSVFDKSNPFREIYFHYGFSKYPILALTNWGESDPIVEFAKSLRKTGSKDDYQLAGKVSPKLRVFVPVIVRGQEHEGVRLWEFGKGIYNDLLGIAADEDYGDYTDINDGRDFSVDAYEDMTAGKKSIKCNVRIKPKTSAITNDAELLKAILENQPDILAINRKFTFDQLKEVLENWLTPTDDEAPQESIVSDNESETTTEDNFVEELRSIPAASSYTEPKKGKTSASDKFDALF